MNLCYEFFSEMAQIQLNDPPPLHESSLSDQTSLLEETRPPDPSLSLSQMSSLQYLLLQTLRVILSLSHQAYQPLTDQRPAILSPLQEQQVVSVIK